MRELGIGFVAYAPLGQGFLTGRLRSLDQLELDDQRRDNPRFGEGNLERNLRIVDAVAAVAHQAGASPAQVALAWLLAQGDDIAVIPGTRRVGRLEENVAADSLVLTDDQLTQRGSLARPVGDLADELPYGARVLAVRLSVRPRRTLLGRPPSLVLP